MYELELKKKLILLFFFFFFRKLLLDQNHENYTRKCYGDLRNNIYLIIYSC
jgi:hypothetical protein